MAARLGFWSAVAIAVAFVLYTVAFVGILLTSPLFMWTNLEDYIFYTQHYGQSLQHLARFLMLLFGPLFVVLLNCIHDTTLPDRRVLSRIALSFGIAFAVLSSINYFVQLSTVRLSLASGQTAGLEHIVQANPYSTITAINMLGWTLFLGLASLFVAPVFGGDWLARIIRGAFLLNGVFCLVGGVGYVLEITALVFLTINLGLGVAVLVAAVGLAVWFRRGLDGVA